MPIYAYRCATCGHAQDVLQKISDPVLTDCPACGAATYVKQVTAAGFQLKGSGWYVTDFKGGSNAAPKKEAEEGKSSAEGDAVAAKGDKTVAEAQGDAVATPAAAKSSDASAKTTAAPAPASPAPSPSGSS